MLFPGRVLSHLRGEAVPMDTDLEFLRASTRKLLDLAQREQARLVIFGHDGEQWQRLKKAPDFYS